MQKQSTKNKNTKRVLLIVYVKRTATSLCFLNHLRL